MLNKQKKLFQVYREQSNRENRDRKSAGKERKPVDGVYAHICYRVQKVLGMSVVLLTDLQDAWQRSENLLGYVC